jgi:hypothetical protein
MEHENIKLARAFAAFSLPSQQASKSKELGFDPCHPAAPDGSGVEWIRSVHSPKARSTSHLLIAPGADGLPCGSFSTLRLIDLTERANTEDRMFTLPAASVILSRFKGPASARAGEQIKAFNRALDLIADATFCYMPSRKTEVDTSGRLVGRESDETKIARGDFIREWRKACRSGAPLPDSQPEHGIFVFHMFSYREGSACRLSETAYQILTGGEVNGWKVGDYVPLRLSSVRTLSGNHSALTLYCFLNARKKGIDPRLDLSLYQLWTQIGGMHPAKSFYDSVKRSLPLVKAVWPEMGAFYNPGANADSETGRFKKAPKLAIMQGRPQAFVPMKELMVDLNIARHEEQLQTERQLEIAAKLDIPRWNLSRIDDSEVERLKRVVRRRKMSMEDTEKAIEAMRRKQEQDALLSSRLEDLDPFDI